MPSAVSGLLTDSLNGGQPGPGYVRLLMVGTMELWLNSGKYVADGNPSAPSYQQGRPGILRFIDWPVKSGTRTLSISVKQTPDASPYPRVRLKANPGIGVNSDVVGDAVAGSGWQTIGPLTINPTGDGVVSVWLEVRHQSMSGYALWDNLQVD